MKYCAILSLLTMGSVVTALDGSSLTECASMKATNDNCKSTSESCGFWLSKKGDEGSRDTYQYGCILTKFCKTTGLYEGQETKFNCPYGEKDRMKAEARQFHIEHVDPESDGRHYIPPGITSNLKFPSNSFGVRTVWDRLGRDAWLVLELWSGLWMVQMLPPFVINQVGDIWETVDENGNNWNNGWFKFCEWYGTWGIH